MSDARLRPYVGVGAVLFAGGLALRGTVTAWTLGAALCLLVTLPLGLRALRHPREGARRRLDRDAGGDPEPTDRAVARTRKGGLLMVMLSLFFGLFMLAA